VGPRVSYVRLQVHIGLSYTLYLLARIRGFHTYYWHIICFHSYYLQLLRWLSLFRHAYINTYICSFSTSTVFWGVFSLAHNGLTYNSVSVYMGSNNTSTSGTYWTLMNTTGTYCIGFQIHSTGHRRLSYKL
jgi:hypothetical protein